MKHFQAHKLNCCLYCWAAPAREVVGPPVASGLPPPIRRALGTHQLLFVQCMVAKENHSH